MKRLFITLTVLAAALSFSACDLNGLKDRDTDSEIIYPGKDDNGGSTGDNGGSTEDNGGNTEDNTGDNGGNTDDNTDNNTVDRSQYEQYNHTFTQGDAIYYGAYYDEQPEDVANWWIELADNNFSLEDYSGEGYNIVLEFFCKGTTPAAGTYTIDAFDKVPFSHLSLLYAYLDEGQVDGETVQYPAGTWLYKGVEAIAGATDGEMTIAVSGTKYTVSYTLYDDDYKITFKGTYTGDLALYDGTESAPAAAPQKVAKSARDLAPAKPARVFRVKK